MLINALLDTLPVSMDAAEEQRYHFIFLNTPPVVSRWGFGGLGAPLYIQVSYPRGYGAVGSAPHWQCGGHGFESR